MAPPLAVRPVRARDREAAKARLDSLTKPQGSLGRLEELAMRLAGMAAGAFPLAVAPARMFTAAGDHGVARQGVSPYPQAVTRQMVRNFLNGGAAVNALCAANGLDLRIVDAGCAGGPFAAHPLLIDRRMGDGTADMTAGPAMSRETCLNAVAAGRGLAAEAASQGFRCLATGEMGIANTTPATALYCACLGLEPETMAGPGTGADPAMIAHKAAVVRRALAVNARALSAGDAVDALACVGGFEIALLCGIMLGAAEAGLPVLVDGFICTAAYVAGRAICPDLAAYAILTHASAEPGHRLAMARLGERPLLDLGMRLGEGTGAAVAYGLVRSAAAVYNGMATFSQANVDGKEAVEP